MLSLRRLDGPRATKSIGADFERIFGAQNGPKCAQFEVKNASLRLLGGLWAAKSIFVRL